VTFQYAARKSFGRAPVGAGHAREYLFADMARSYTHAVVDLGWYELIRRDELLEFA
jgi:hypothetical protein